MITGQMTRTLRFLVKHKKSFWIEKVYYDFTYRQILLQFKPELPKLDEMEIIFRLRYYVHFHDIYRPENKVPTNGQLERFSEVG